MRRHLNKVRMSKEVIKEAHRLKNKQLKLSSGENNLVCSRNEWKGSKCCVARIVVPGQSKAVGDTVGEQSRFGEESWSRAKTSNFIPGVR